MILQVVHTLTARTATVRAKETSVRWVQTPRRLID